MSWTIANEQTMEKNKENRSPAKIKGVNLWDERLTIKQPDEAIMQVFLAGVAGVRLARYITETRKPVPNWPSLF